ncbi:hydroxypyruvate isomerase [Endozoicomonas montiporae]|uniref:Hydroxypyruvate isomerase n=2 Tax=Endozoicomonas montiporae TaxID=1027273 RepID=A0A081N5I5_9GAMM|nr:hydroxypyruvate isomerase [Endozoicomonas montiporae]AMO57402.1 hydroxypyruvate isomerase [Endozoicomonas montiporae CL-33]KEQ13708.1 hydroxypyruvate isomerase [Endozoicomonas montiporae]
MPKLAANLSMLFTETDFLDRFEAAAKAGFKGVEYLFPYDYPVDVIAEKLKQNDLEQVLFNLPAGDWASGDRGIACNSARMEEFGAGVDQAIAYARVLGNTQINCLTGIVPEGVPAAEAEATVVSNLKYAADKLEEAGIRLIIEAINTRDIPGFFLTSTAQALKIKEQVGSDNLLLQYDIYHMQIMEGDIATTCEQHLDVIQHVQLADNPGRHEPGTGEINYHFMLSHLDRIGYKGRVGCEYKPATTTEEGLGWLKTYNQI